MIEGSSNSLDGKIVSTRREAQNVSSPVVVVGLPRSGSSYLSSVMSQLEDWYVFDDLYLHRRATGLKATTGQLTHSQIDELVFFLGWQVRARIKFPKFNVPKLALQDVDLFDKALAQTFHNELDAGLDVRWYDLQNEFLYRLADLHGCQRWGYKAPQDFLRLHQLKEIYPELRVVYLYRRPHDVASSYKYLSGSSSDGVSTQYHPFVYSRYWRMAHETVAEFAAKYPSSVCNVKFEELVAGVETEAGRLASFLGATLQKPLRQEAKNSSFGEGSERLEISGLEARMINRGVGPNVLASAGYIPVKSKIGLLDGFDLFATSLRFGWFQIKRFVRDPAARVSILSYVKRLLRR